MNLDELRTVQADERGSDNIRPLPDSFYRDVAAYIDGLREDRKQSAEGTADPFGSENVRRLTDEIETAEEVVEAIYERRVSKVVKRASLTAAGMPADADGLTDEESALYNELVAVIEANRETILDVLTAESEPSSPTQETSNQSARTDESDDPTETPSGEIDQTDKNDRSPADHGSDTEPESDVTPTTSSQPDHDASPPPEQSADRVTIRVTRDVGEIFGVDQRVYNLSSEDIVTLPVENAQPLIDRDAAERIS